METLHQKSEDENKELKEANKALLKRIETLNKEVQMQNKTIIAQEKQLSDVKATLDKEIQDENKALKVKQDQLKAENSNLNTTLVLQKEKAIQLEEARIAQERELNDTRAKMNKEKNTAIAKEKEYLKEKEKLQSDLQAAKKHNHILLSENSQINSKMQKLQDTYNQVSHLKEDIHKSKIWFKQNSEEFIQKIPLLKQKVEENILLKKKANQDCSLVICECDKLARKLNATLYEIRCLKGN